MKKQLLKKLNEYKKWVHDDAERNTDTIDPRPHLIPVGRMLDFINELINIVYVAEKKERDKKYAPIRRKLSRVKN